MFLDVTPCNLVEICVRLQYRRCLQIWKNSSPTLKMEAGFPKELMSVFVGSQIRKDIYLIVTAVITSNVMRLDEALYVFTS
jgi:hypothetical protein